MMRLYKAVTIALVCAMPAIYLVIWGYYGLMLHESPSMNNLWPLVAIIANGGICLAINIARYIYDRDY